MPDFNFDNATRNLASINQYLESKGVELSGEDKAKLNSIFKDSDTYNTKERKAGSDGLLNNDEWAKFVDSIKAKIPTILKNIETFNQELFRSIINKNKPSSEMPLSVYVAEPDATRVAVLHDIDKLVETPVPHETKVRNLPQKITKNSDIKTDYEWSVEEFDKVLKEMLDAPRFGGKFKNSVLRNQAAAFIEAGKKYGVDPRVLVSIAMVESERGISRKARELNNVGGLIINGKYHHFESVAASVDSIARTVNTRYSEGYTTLSKIGNSGKYCASAAANSWVSQSSSYFNYFDKYYKPDN